MSWAHSAVTENTRASYPINYIPNARIPCMGPHPKNLILLCCDAFGVLPPVSRLTKEQAMYYFISGYTAKVRSSPFSPKLIVHFKEMGLMPPRQHEVLPYGKQVASLRSSGSISCLIAHPMTVC